MASRTLNFDEMETIDVVIGGRTFTLKPQRRSLLQRILADSFKQPDLKEVAEEHHIDTLFRAFEHQLPTYPLLFGFDNAKSEEYKEVLAFFKENLSPKMGVEIFRAWWELNEVDAFFQRAGMTLYPLSLVNALQDELATN